MLAILFHYSYYFHIQLHYPTILSSWGAAAVLFYGTPEAPMTQPRAVFFGNLISSFIGVAITKLFLEINTPEDAFEHVQWIAAASSVSISLVIMQMTKTVHPPGGAVAISCMTQDNLRRLGWQYLGFVMLSATLMTAWALIINNIERQYPIFWWTPVYRPHPDPQEAPDQDGSSTTVGSDDILPVVDALPKHALNDIERDAYTIIRQKVQAAANTQ
ncbi:hypothetical protein K492DRAFT_190734 [Lichtheimia hyalospora FSU 10163]|nr:hypothetical protein K492DRAFT_190734 [Lichtheimia hyalospora FSU 10163]